jgi:putative ABC transport system permease protein
MLAMVIEPVRAGQVLLLTIVMCCASALIAVRKLRAADPADVF